MKIVIISDTHNYHNQLSLPDGDLLLHCGDYTSYGTPKQVQSFLDWLIQLPHKHKVFINGNHELQVSLIPGYMKSLELPDNVHYLENSGVTIEGLNLWGSPLTARFGQWAYMYDRSNGWDIWEAIPSDTDILLTHGPPYGYGDEVPYPFPNEDPMVGCEDLLNKIFEVKPKLHCFGHIHDGYGIYEGPEGIKFINASTCTESYDPWNEPIVLTTNAPSAPTSQM